MVDKGDEPLLKLLCAWHVTRSLEQNILSKLKGNKLKEFAFHHLQTIMSELDEQKFEIMLQQFRTSIKLDDNTKNFSKYFESDYAKRVKEWCYCYRKGFKINTNMATESMHRIIKQNYFKGKVVKRLDKALNLLLLYLRDKKRQHLIKSHKGKRTRRHTNIYNNHQKAINSKDKFAIDGGNDVYVLSNDTEVHNVTVSNGVCPNEPCGLKYKDCDICLDLIKCTCFENSIHFEMCRHCHLVMLHRLCKSSSTTEKEAPQQQLPNFMIADIDDRCDFEISENQELPTPTELQVEDRFVKNIDVSVTEVTKRMAELMVAVENAQK